MYSLWPYTVAWEGKSYRRNASCVNDYDRISGIHEAFPTRYITLKLGRGKNNLNGANKTGDQLESKQFRAQLKARFLTYSSKHLLALLLSYFISFLWRTYYLNTHSVYANSIKHNLKHSHGRHAGVHGQQTIFHIYDHYFI
jgi:hypothetical protein